MQVAALYLETFNIVKSSNFVLDPENLESICITLSGGGAAVYCDQKLVEAFTQYYSYK